jgi:hypothetical protein
MRDPQLGEGARYKTAVQAGNTEYDDSLLPGITQRRRDHRVRFSSPDSRVNAQMGNQSIPKQVVKPATYDGSASWLDYHAHFEAYVEING